MVDIKRFLFLRRTYIRHKNETPQIGDLSSRTVSEKVGIIIIIIVYFYFFVNMVKKNLHPEETFCS